MGSGHMLTYSFDMLYEIYEDLGWSRKDAVLSILKNNLYGLEIDKRAGQLASFAMIMKGREKFPRLLKVLERLEDEEKFDLNTLWIDESNDISQGMRKLINSNSLKNLEILIDNFTDAKEYGSILKLTSLDIAQAKEELERLIEIYKRQGQLILLSTSNQLDFSVVDINFEKECRITKKLIQQQKIMTDTYDIAITNPPYMGGKGFDSKLKKYVETYYKDSKADLFAVFMERCGELTKRDRYTSMITMHSWMFLSSFENLRKNLIETKEIQSLTHLGTRAFEELGGEVVQTVGWITKNTTPKKEGKYIRLVDFNNAQWKEQEFFNDKNYYQATQKEFDKIPSSPIAYWVSDKIREAFEKNKKLGDIGEAKQGLATADNNRFLRLWNEVNYNKIGFGMSNSDEALESMKKWFPYNKGGEKRKWYGNQEYLVNWENDGYEIKNFYDEKGKLRSRPQNTEYYFRNSISWGLITSAGSSFRYYPNGFIYDVGGMSYFIENNIFNYLGMLNTKIYEGLTKIINPTINLQIGDVIALPSIEIEGNEVTTLVQQNIDIAKEEWDSRETSWDFETLYLAKGDSIESAYNDYCNHWRDNFVTMHRNEEELNKIFIDIYELNDEMDNSVPFEDITLLKKEAEIEEILIPAQHIADIEEKEKTSEGYLYNRGVKLKFDKLELVKQFLSYAVGCIMGRYSIDKKGLIIANSDDVLETDKNSIYIKDENGEIRHHIENPRFIPDSYGIIPITSEKVFDNDIVTKVIEFVEALYGKENLEKNLEFICNALGRKGDEKYDTTLRNYFIKDFYTDHLQRYQKRPIYWLKNSGKKNGFSALIYLHRYEKNSVARVRTEYLLPYQDKLENLRAYYERITFDDDASAKEKKQAEKALKELDAMLKELRDYANEVKHIAELKIDLDLDDGVKVNYEKFGKVLKKI